MQKRDLRVIGTGFDAYDGLIVRIIVTLGEPDHGLGEAAVTSGRFDITLPGVLGNYTGIAVHIDRVRNDACDADTEVIWQVTSGPLSALGPGFSTTPSGAAVWTIVPDTLRVQRGVGPCSINGIFDLTNPVRC